jgi:hypothetical protein
MSKNKGKQTEAPPPPPQTTEASVAPKIPQKDGYMHYVLRLSPEEEGTSIDKSFVSYELYRFLCTALGDSPCVFFPRGRCLPPRSAWRHLPPRPRGGGPKDSLHAPHLRRHVLKRADVPLLPLREPVGADGADEP